MKRLYVLVSFTFLITFNTTIVHSQNVSIPDSVFKAFLVGLTVINTNGDTAIQVVEAQAFSGTIDVSNMGISDLTGIAAFTALTQLQCQFNQLSALDVSNNTALTHLQCQFNQLSALDVSNNTALTYFNCSSNLLTALNVSNNTALTHLYCYSNQLSTLDVSNNTALMHLFCSSNLLTALGVSNNTALNQLYCNSNQLSTLNISTNTALTHLRCYYNQLTALDVSTNTALTHLRCYNNQLTSLDVSNNTALAYLYCYNNQLTALDVSNNTALTHLFCDSNQLSILDIKNGNNLNMSNFDSRNNPNLICIQVDSVAYSIANWTDIDATSSFSADCSTFNSTSSITGTLTDITLFPNPTTKKLTLQLSEYQQQQSDVQICNSLGQVVFDRTYENVQQVELELNGAPGMYFVRVRTDEGQGVLTVVKEN